MGCPLGESCNARHGDAEADAFGDPGVSRARVILDFDELEVEPDAQLLLDRVLEDDDLLMSLFLLTVKNSTDCV